MTIRKCDRCGKICSILESNQIIYPSELHVDVVDDLCPVCYEEFLTWRNKKDVPEEAH